MISYELAKELKDAGFAADRDVLGTQTGVGGGHTWLYGPKGVESDDMAYVPTLSELIAACGEDFELLTIQPVGEKWRADSWPFGGKKMNVEGKGQTPEEAVAKLWLAVHKKT